MIKLTRHLYIHWLTIALFACAYITRTLGLTAAVYSVMLLHELAHTAAAVWLKLGVSHIILYPFGVTLKVRSRMLCSLYDEIILYLSGPCVNISAALICGVFFDKNAFYYNNIILFALNMLPVLPLDGGYIALRVLSSKIGEACAGRILKAGAVILSALIVTAVLMYGELNINTLTFCAFILAGIFTQRSKYSRDFVRELSCTGAAGKKVRRADVFFAKSSVPKRRIAGQFNPSRGALVVLCDDDGKIERLMTKEEVVASVLNAQE